MMASSRRRRAESKILPQIAYFVADRGVRVFEIAEHRSLVYGKFGSKAQCEGNCSDESTGVGEEIAVRGVEGEVVLVAEADPDAGADVARSGGDDSTVGCDGGGDSGVGGAEDPAVIFDGAHADHVEVLPRGAGVAVPAVVGDVNEDFGTLFGEFANLVAKDGLVADEGSVGVAARGEDDSVLAGIEGARFVEQTLCEEEKFLERDVLAEGDEVHLVVAGYEFPLRADEGGGVEEVVAAWVVSGAVSADVACDDGRAGLAGEIRHREAELRVVFLEGRG